jgi:DNA-binding MarR family transcriptional regulator
MTDAAIDDSRRLGEAQRAASTALDLLLAEIGITFDRWVVLSAVATGSVPAEVGLLVPALSAALDTTDETVRFMLDEAESDHHVRVVSAPSGDPAAVRVELTAEGDVLHERLRAAIDELAADLAAGLPKRDDLGVRFGR